MYSVQNSRKKNFDSSYNTTAIEGGKNLREDNVQRILLENILPFERSMKISQKLNSFNSNCCPTWSPKLHSPVIPPLWYRLLLSPSLLSHTSPISSLSHSTWTTDVAFPACPREVLGGTFLYSVFQSFTAEPTPEMTIFNCRGAEEQSASSQLLPEMANGRLPHVWSTISYICGGLVLIFSSLLVKLCSLMPQFSFHGFLNLGLFQYERYQCNMYKTLLDINEKGCSVLTRNLLQFL